MNTSANGYNDAVPLGPAQEMTGVAIERIELCILSKILTAQSLAGTEDVLVEDFPTRAHRKFFAWVRDEVAKDGWIDLNLLANDQELNNVLTDAIGMGTEGEVIMTPLAAYVGLLRDNARKGRDLQGMAVALGDVLQRMEKPDHQLLDAVSALQAEITRVVTRADEKEEPHPLDIEPSAGLKLGWIDEYADFMTMLTVSPPEFNRLAALTLVATVIQRRARLRMSFGDIYPNIYGVVIARSSVFHKSSATAKARSMLQRALLDNLLLSELMTSEGLLKQLQDKPCGLVIRDEIGTLFSSHNTKYLASLKPDLTALYDGYPYSRRLSNEEVKVPAPYLNILGATTPARFFDGVTFTDWQDGFLARWLFVLPENEPDFDAMTGLFTTEHDVRMEQLALALMKLDKEPAQDFTLSPDAFALWDKWQRKAAREAYYYGDDITAAIVTRYAAYALKFGIILAAINGQWGVITIETMQTAMALADNYKATVYKLLTEKANYGVSGAKLQKVFRVIKGKAGLDGLTAREIGRICNMRKGELAPCIEKLVSIGGVITMTSGKAERYIPAVESLPAKTW